MIKIIILGSGTCVPSLRRGSSGILIQTSGKTILIDSGTGTLHKLLKIGITYSDIDIICYTHIHPDHISELVPLLFACKYSGSPRKKDLTIIGGDGFAAFFTSLQDAFRDWLKPDMFSIHCKEVFNKSIDFENFSITASPMEHMKESVGFKIKDDTGKTIVISGDTDYCPNIVTLGKNADLLVLECSHPDDGKTKGHLTPSLAGKIAKESDCKKLMLTHFYPECDKIDILGECKKVYSGKIMLADDLKVYKI